MKPFQRLRPAVAEPLWQDTLPSLPAFGDGPGRGISLSPYAVGLDGVEVDELDSATVFDQFFGAPELRPR